MDDVRQGLKIAHISDLHFGQIQNRGLVVALFEDLSRFDLDLIVVSGDHTQRSRDREWKLARSFLKSLKPPLLAVQGNHDIPPYWEPINRLLYSQARFDQYLGDFVREQCVLGGIAFLGVDSTDPRKTTGGTIDSKSLVERIKRLLSESSVSKIVVCLHHPLYDYSCKQAPGFVADYHQLVSKLSLNGCSMVLHGHLHRSLISVEKTAYGSIHHVCAGTATSSRSRETHLPWQSYNVISFRQNEVEIEQRGYNPDLKCFDSYDMFISTW